MVIDFKNSMSNPYSVDTGNKSIQGNTVSKTVQFGLFTTNKNAVWAANNQLQKESFPFAFASCPVNRNMFRLQVGDVFLYTYPPHGISEMVCRVLQIEEESLESENIIIHARQDVFSVSNAITQYSAPTDNAGQPQEYETEAFDNQDVFEAPFVLSEDIKIIPVAGRKNQLDIGFILYMSVDGGVSYSVLSSSSNIQPFGNISNNYGLTYAIDRDGGIYVNFVSDVDSIENETWTNVLSGNKNIAILGGTEIISFQNITPISGTIYHLENVIRGRWGTVKEAHSTGADFWFIQKNIELLSDGQITAGASRKFKLVPFNNKKSGSLVDATPITIVIEGESQKPYEPNNFYANGEGLDPSYISGTDITLDWAPRIRGKGAGSMISGVPVITNTDHEGLFRVEVWVSAVKVRDTNGIDAITWDYTNAMNVSDNGTQADTITFILFNYRIVGGITYESDGVTVICDKE